jgi:hypothetical protein
MLRSYSLCPCSLPLVLALWLLQPSVSVSAEITRIWLNYPTNTPDRLAVHWETAQPGNSVVQWGRTKEYGNKRAVDESVTLHQVEIPIEADATEYHYLVSTGDESSVDAVMKVRPNGDFRAALVADWQGKPRLDALLNDDIHLLLTAGDNIDSLHGLCGKGIIDCTKPYSRLIDKYPEVFRSVPFMPVLGNHDREIQPRGAGKPPPETVYDPDATAFRKFFSLPDDEWKWHFDLPQFGIRFVGLDLNHIQDMGTTWQTCHKFDKDSPQFQWYEKLMTGPKPPFVVTLQNERSGTMRSQEKMAWHKLFSRGTLVVTGFGYFAERAEFEGFPYYNTSLSGKGAKYPDPHSKFFASEDSYVLLTLAPGSKKLVVELKGLDGRVLDRQEYSAKD